MTRHTWRPGGATYYPMDGSRQRDPLGPDDVIAALDAMAQEIENLRAELDGRAPVTNNPNDPKLSTPRGPTLPCGGMAVNYVGEPNTVYDSSLEHWSPWLEWRGGPCPLPGDVVVEVSFRGEHDDSGIVDEFYWDRRDPNSDIIRFRYHADNHAGWLPRGEFIPPAELWDEGCPVRCEWSRVPLVQLKPGGCIEPGTDKISSDRWADNGVTHIRLVARQPQAALATQPEPGAVPELPEWVKCDEDGDYIVHFDNGLGCCLAPHYRAEDYDRIAEACRILAARERARRAGS